MLFVWRPLQKACLTVDSETNLESKTGRKHILYECKTFSAKRLNVEVGGAGESLTNDINGKMSLEGYRKPSV